MAVPVIITNVQDDGSLSEQVRRQLSTLLRGMAGRTVQIRVGLHKSPRSVPANRRYFSLLQAGCESLGYDTVAELHEAVAWHLLREPDDQRLGNTPRRKRTPRLNSTEFMDYTDRVFRLLIDYGADLSTWAEREQVITDGL